MCGIVGVISRNTVSYKKMLASIVHRGPDDEGVFIQKLNEYSIVLGHRRLSIIDLSHAGHQPMPNESKKLWITYNGELYNFKDIKRDLERLGYKFNSHCDTEVILKSYQQWGVDCLQKFNGMFAFAIWDSDEKKLFLARDHAGQKPLYYSILPDGGIIFASEIKALLASDILESKVNIYAIPEYFSFSRVHAPQTMFQNIYKLESAHYLTWENSHINQKQWWDPLVSHNVFQGTLQEASGELNTLCLKSIQRHMIADVSVGAFLSGGLDSSLITTIATKLSQQPVKTFTTGFDQKNDTSIKNELQYARKLYALLGKRIDYNEILLDSNIVELFQKIIWHLDEPIADPAELNAYVICQLAKKHGITVLLSGMGADEIFGGYNHHLILAHSRYLKRFKGLHNILSTFASLFPFSKNTSFQNFIYFLKRKDKFFNEDINVKFIGFTSSFIDEDIINIFHPDIKENYRNGKYKESKLKYFNTYQSIDLLSRVLYTDFKTFLPEQNLMYTDKTGMASSCEIRSPFLDREIVEFAFSLPSQFKIHNFKTKYILKKVAENYLPREIVWQKKSGFAAPIHVWKKEIQNIAHELLSPSHLNDMGYFNKNSVQTIIREHAVGVNNRSLLLWSLITFAQWHKIFIEKK